jgi:hypothetical protein
MIRFLLMPISAAVSASCATARMPFPTRLRFTKTSSEASMSRAIASTSRAVLVNRNGPIENTTLLSTTVGMPNGARLVKMPINSAISSEAPIAVMRKANGGALRLRSGR